LLHAGGGAVLADERGPELQREPGLAVDVARVVADRLSSGVQDQGLAGKDVDQLRGELEEVELQVVAQQGRAPALDAAHGAVRGPGDDVVLGVAHVVHCHAGHALRNEGVLPRHGLATGVDLGATDRVDRCDQITAHVLLPSLLGARSPGPPVPHGLPPAPVASVAGARRTPPGTARAGAYTGPRSPAMIPTVAPTRG